MAAVGRSHRGSVRSRRSRGARMCGMDRVRALNDDDEAFERWYGPWTPLTPAGVAAALAGCPATWWIVGGWPIDAFTGRPRDPPDLAGGLPPRGDPLADGPRPDAGRRGDVGLPVRRVGANPIGRCPVQRRRWRALPPTR